MYILIEHNGTEESLKIASAIQDHVEDSRGYTCDQVVSHDPHISLYDSSMNLLTSFNSKPSEDDLNFYLEMVTDNGEDK